MGNNTTDSAYTNQVFWASHAMCFAMSGVERVRKLRKKRREEAKRSLIEHIVGVVRRSEHATFNADIIRQYWDVLLKEPIERVRELAKAYETHDRTGRNRREAHTGGVDLEKLFGRADTHGEQ
jgi:hypothetical protein